MGLDWHLAHAHILKEMSGLLAVKYNRLPIMLRYSLSSKSFPEESKLSLTDVLIGVLECFEEFIPNLFKRLLGILRLRKKYPVVTLLDLKP